MSQSTQRQAGQSWYVVWVLLKGTIVHLSRLPSYILEMARIHTPGPKIILVLSVQASKTFIEVSNISHRLLLSCERSGAAAQNFNPINRFRKEKFVARLRAQSAF